MKLKQIILVAVLALAAVACGTPTSGNANTNEATQVNRQQDIYNKTQPIPLFDYSQDRATLLQIYSAKNEARQTWAVVFSNNGVPLWSCPSIGFPIPTTTQLTNPDSYGGGAYGYFTLPQAEPNGLYTGDSLATYILCVRPNGDVVPLYAEPLVMLFPFEIKIVDGKVVDAGGASTMNIEVKGGTSSVAPQPSPSK